MDAFIVTAPGVIARIRTVTPVRLGVATLNYTTPSPPLQTILTFYSSAVPESLHS